MNGIRINMHGKELLLNPALATVPAVFINNFNQLQYQLESQSPPKLITPAYQFVTKYFDLSNSD